MVMLIVANALMGFLHIMCSISTGEDVAKHITALMVGGPDRLTSYLSIYLSIYYRNEIELLVIYNQKSYMTFLCSGKWCLSYTHRTNYLLK
jgi:hypothetical protein